MEFISVIWKEAAWTKNAILAPITVGVVVAVISAISTWLIRKYLKSQDEVSDERFKTFMATLTNFDKKLTAFCTTNHEEHEKADNKLRNHDHDPTSGKPRFYV